MNIRNPFLLLILTLTQLAHGQADTPGVHDPVVIRCGDYYYLFSTGQGIPIRRSRDLFSWSRIGRVFEGMQPWTQEKVPGSHDFWAPDISLHNGEYRLYYSVSTFGKNGSCIALATNVTLDPNDPKYKWIDHGPIVESHAGDDFNAIDPNAFTDVDGKQWLTFGSYWSGIKIVRLDEKTGKRAGDEMHALAARPKEKSVEAPFLVHRDGWYYLFVSFDQCCQGAKSTYRTMVGRSKSLLGPYVDRAGDAMLEGHATPLLEGYDNIRGPGHNAVIQVGKDWYIVHHYYDANERGARKLHIRPLAWSEDGWPKPGDPLAVPLPTTRQTTQP